MSSSDVQYSLDRGWALKSVALPYSCFFSPELPRVWEWGNARDGETCRSALHGEILAVNIHSAPIDLALPRDDIVTR